MLNLSVTGDAVSGPPHPTVPPTRCQSSGTFFSARVLPAASRARTVTDPGESISNPNRHVSGPTFSTMMRRTVGPPPGGKPRPLAPVGVAVADGSTVCGAGRSVAREHASGVHSCTQETLRVSPSTATVTKLIHAIAGQTVAQPETGTSAGSKTVSHARDRRGVMRPA